METRKEKWERRVWQHVYDLAFCEALEKGYTFAQCAEYADDKVLQGAIWYSQA